MTKFIERRSCNQMIRDIVREEIAAREWKDPAKVIAELSKCSQANADRLLRFEGRLTQIECWMLDSAFGVSAGFFSRLQDHCERAAKALKG